MHSLPDSSDDDVPPGDAADRPAPLIVDLKLLGRFRARMADHSVIINVARMMYDRAYAFDRIALAHSNPDEAVQRLALQLFSLYDKRAKPRD